MPRYKVTYGMQIGSIGGSESYITPDQSAATATSTIQTLINLRRQMLHEDVVITGIRFALLSATQKRRSAFYPPGDFYPLAKPDANGVGGVSFHLVAFGDSTQQNFIPDQARACGLVRMTYDTDRNTPHYLFAVPDACLGKEPNSFDPARVPTWNNLFKAFRNTLLSAGWSIRARRRDAGFTPFDVATWTTASTGPANLGAVITSGTSPGITQGQLIQVLGTRRKGTDTMSYNGKYVVDNVAAGPGTNQYTIFLRDSAAGDASSIKTLGRVQAIGYDYYPIQDVEAIKAATHKRGRPFGIPSGRRKSRVLLDP